MFTVYSTKLIIGSHYRFELGTLFVNELYYLQLQENFNDLDLLVISSMNLRFPGSSGCAWLSSDHICSSTC